MSQRICADLGHRAHEVNSPDATPPALLPLGAIICSQRLQACRSPPKNWHECCPGKGEAARQARGRHGPVETWWHHVCDGGSLQQGLDRYWGPWRAETQREPSGRRGRRSSGGRGGDRCRARRRRVDKASVRKPPPAAARRRPRRGHRGVQPPGAPHPGAHAADGARLPRQRGARAGVPPAAARLAARAPAPAPAGGPELAAGALGLRHIGHPRRRHGTGEGRESGGGSRGGEGRREGAGKQGKRA